MSQYPEIDFTELNRWIYTRDRKSLCDEFEITRQYLSNLLRGKRRNMKVLNRALELAKNNKSATLTINTQLKQI